MREVVLLGHPVGTSLSPDFQNAGMEAAGHAVRYRAMDVQEGGLADVLHSNGPPRWLGANVTVPHKEAVLAFAGRVTPLAQIVRSANTLWWDANGRLVAGCSDVFGARVALGSLGLASSARALVLGAGGAARAVIRAHLEGSPGQEKAGGVDVVCRRPEEVRRSMAPLLHWAQERQQDVTIWAWSSLVNGGGAAGAWARADVVVDATSVVTLPSDRQAEIWKALPWDALRVDAALFDLSVRRETTLFMRHGQAKGLCVDRVIDGAGMLLHQGVLSWNAWFGEVDPPVAVMRTALEMALGRPLGCLSVAKGAWRTEAL